MKRLWSPNLFLLSLILLLSFAAYSQTQFSKSDQSAYNTPEVYIPADKRHQGLSRYDVLPFTDRKKGDPDRYRAINPNYFKKENGNYYFLISAKSGAHFFDENLTDKGALPGTNLEVDLTQTKSAKTGDEKSAKYVYAKNIGYILQSDLTNTAAEMKAGRWFSFPLKDGKHNLYDGTGIERGIIAAKSVKLNYGQIKNLNGENYYYAFSTKILITGSGEPVGASGWIKASAIQDGNQPQYDPEFTRKMQMPTGADDTFTGYEITGGDPQEIIGKDENGKPKYKFGYRDEKGEFVPYKVLPNVLITENVASTDYLKRSDDVINLGFNVAGVSNDTFRVSGANRSLIFHRSSDKDATAAIDLFYPKGSGHDAEKAIEKMIFVYGYIDTPAGKRWGWMPLGALKIQT